MPMVLHVAITRGTGLMSQCSFRPKLNLRRNPWFSRESMHFGENEIGGSHIKERISLQVAFMESLSLRIGLLYRRMAPHWLQRTQWFGMGIPQC